MRIDWQDQNSLEEALVDHTGSYPYLIPFADYTLLPVERNLPEADALVASVGFPSLSDNVASKSGYRHLEIVHFDGEMTGLS